METYSTVLKHLGLEVGAKLVLNLTGHGLENLITRLNRHGASLFVAQTEWTFYPNQVLDPMSLYQPIIETENNRVILYGHKQGINVGGKILFPEEAISPADLHKIAKMLGGKLELVNGSWTAEIKARAPVSLARISLLDLDRGKVTCRVIPKN